MAFCSGCGTNLDLQAAQCPCSAIDEKDRFCAECGAMNQLQEEHDICPKRCEEWGIDRFCAECGWENDREYDCECNCDRKQLKSRYCTKCGEKLITISGYKKCTCREEEVPDCSRCGVKTYQRVYYCPKRCTDVQKTSFCCVCGAPNEDICDCDPFRCKLRHCDKCGEKLLFYRETHICGRTSPCYEDPLILCIRGCTKYGQDKYCYGCGYAYTNGAQCECDLAELKELYCSKCGHAISKKKKKNHHRQRRVFVKLDRVCRHRRGKFGVSPSSWRQKFCSRRRKSQNLSQKGLVVSINIH